MALCIQALIRSAEGGEEGKGVMKVLLNTVVNVVSNYHAYISPYCVVLTLQLLKLVSSPLYQGFDICIGYNVYVLA